VIFQKGKTSDPIMQTAQDSTIHLDTGFMADIYFLTPASGC